MTKLFWVSELSPGYDDDQRETLDIACEQRWRETEPGVSDAEENNPEPGASREELAATPQQAREASENDQGSSASS